jgi:hypothetical protein
MLDHWCRQGYVPGATLPGSGRARTFDARQVRHVRILALLTRVGIVPEKAWTVAWEVAGDNSLLNVVALDDSLILTINTRKVTMRATTCLDCGQPAEVTRPDPDHDGEQVGYCGLHEPQDA